MYDFPRLRPTFQSTHLLRGATLLGNMSAGYAIFQSTHLLRGATLLGNMSAGYAIFQSTHLLRGATLKKLVINIKRQFQSTHLLRGATEDLMLTGLTVPISIHAPLARCDPCFNLQLSPDSYFNPRTSCEVRLWTRQASSFINQISIHAPLARCD